MLQLYYMRDKPKSQPKCQSCDIRNLPIIRHGGNDDLFPAKELL